MDYANEMGFILGDGKRKCFSGEKIVLPVVGSKNHGWESETGCLFYI